MKKRHLLTTLLFSTNILGLTACSSTQKTYSPLVAGTTKIEINKNQITPVNEIAITDWDKSSVQYINTYKEGDYASAENMAKQALILAEKEFGHKSIYTLTSIRDLARLYKAQAHFKKSELLYEEALALMKSIFGNHSLETAKSMNSLAMLYYNQGDFDKAKLLFIKTLALREEVLGKKHQDTLASMNNLAVLYQAQNKFDKAKVLFLKSFSLTKKILGKSHPDTQLSMNNLAILYQDRGLFNKAEPLLLETLALRKVLLGKKHNDTLISMNNLATLYQEQGDYDKAEPLLVEALSLMKEVLGDRHIITLTNMNNLAVLYKAQGRLDKAEPLFVETISLMKEVLGKHHPNTISSIDNLTQLYQDRGLFNKAEPLLLETLALRKSILGKRHINTLISMSNLATLYQAQGRLDKAESLLVKTIPLMKEVLGKQHPNTITSMTNLATLYLVQDKKDKVEPLLVKTLVLSTATLGKQHPDTIIRLFNLAFFNQKYQQWKPAKVYYDKYLFDSNQFLQQVLWGAGEKTRISYLQQQTYRENNYLSFYSYLISNVANKSKESWNKPSALARQAWKLSVSRKGLLLRIASEASLLSKLHQSKDPQLITLSQHIKDTRSQIASLTFSNKPNAKLLAELTDQLNTLQRKLSNKVSYFRDKSKRIQPKHILSALSKQQALVDFLIYKEVDFKTGHYKTEQIIAFVANPGTGVHFIQLGDLLPITHLIKTYRQAIEPNDNNDLWFSSKERQQRLIQTSQALYKKLWQPLSHALDDKKQVFIIPDGILHLLPFKAL